MSDLGYRIVLDGRKASEDAKSFKVDLDRLRKSGDVVSSSMSRLDRILDETGDGMLSTGRAAVELIRAEERIAESASVAASSLGRLRAGMRGTAEEQRELARSIDMSTSGSVDGFSTLARTLPRVGGALAALKLADFVRSSGAAGIELEKLNSRLVTVFGSASSASAEFDFLSATADRLALDINALGAGYSSLAAATRGTALEGQKTRDIFSAVSEASGKLALTADQTGGVLTALQQIVSKGTVSTEELQQIAERLPGTFARAAEAMGVTGSELRDLLERGVIPATDFIPKFGAALRKNFGTDATTQVENLTSGFTRLGNQGAILGKTFFTPVVSGASQAADAFADLINSINDAVASSRNLEDLGNGLFRGGNGVLFQKNKVGGFDFVKRPVGDVLNVPPFAPRPILPDFGSVVPRIPELSGPTGASLLTLNQPVADAERLIEYRKEALKLEQDLAGLTMVQRVTQSIINGDLKDRNILEQQAALDVARKQDALRAQADTTKDLNDSNRDAAEQIAALDKDRARSLNDQLQAEERLQAVFERVLTPVERFRRELAQINQLASDGADGLPSTLDQIALRLGTTTADVRNRLVTQAGERLPRGVEDAETEVQSSLERLSVFSDQAARNIQSSLADALVTGVNDGVGGALLSLARFGQRAAAEAAAAQITSGLFGERKDGKISDGGLIGKAGSFLSSLFDGDGGSLTGRAPVPVTLVGAGGIGGSVFGSPSSPFGGGLGSSLLGSAGIGGSLFGAGSDPFSGASGAIGSDLIASFEKLTSASTAFGAANAQVFGDSTSLAANLGQSLLSGPGAAFTDASSLASSFFSSQAVNGNLELTQGSC